MEKNVILSNKRRSFKLKPIGSTIAILASAFLIYSAVQRWYTTDKTPIKISYEEMFNSVSKAQTPLEKYNTKIFPSNPRITFHEWNGTYLRNNEWNDTIENTIRAAGNYLLVTNIETPNNEDVRKYFLVPNNICFRDEEEINKYIDKISETNLDGIMIRYENKISSREFQEYFLKIDKYAESQGLDLQLITQLKTNFELKNSKDQKIAEIYKKTLATDNLDLSIIIKAQSYFVRD